MSNLDKVVLNGTEYQIASSGGSGSGVTSEFISALQELFYGVAIWNSTKIANPSEKISALSDYAGGDTPTGITISFSNGIMTITGVSTITTKSFSNGVLSLS